MAYGKPAEQIFLGKEIAQHRDHSEATATDIDREVKKIVMGCYEEARRILEERAETLARVAEALLLHETLTAEQIAMLVRGETLPLTPETNTDGRQRIEATPRDEEARHCLLLLPEPGPRPA